MNLASQLNALLTQRGGPVEATPRDDFVEMKGDHFGETHQMFSLRYRYIYMLTPPPHDPVGRLHFLNFLQANAMHTYV